MSIINSINNEDKGSHLFSLRQEHRDLDFAISALIETGKFDQLKLQRLKKKKLILKDKISRFEDDLLPDIIA
jgi:hypothetical protein